MELTLFGAPERIRTHDLLIRSQTLYPAELRVRMCIVISFYRFIATILLHFILFFGIVIGLWT